MAMLPILWKAVHFDRPPNEKFKLEKRNLLFCVQKLCFDTNKCFPQLHAAKNGACASVSNSLALARIPKTTNTNLNELIIEAIMLSKKGMF
jgi:hypothetical protein